MIATDPARECVWVIENVAQRIRRFDLAGDVSLTISGVQGSAIAVDPETGNVWALTGAKIGQGKLVVYDDTGETVVAGSSNRLFSFDADGNQLTAIDLGATTPFRVSVDPKDGSVWVAHFRKSSAGYQGLKALNDPVAPTAKSRLTETIQRIVDLYTAFTIVRQTRAASKPGRPMAAPRMHTPASRLLARPAHGVYNG